jgi:hypothetical protein
MNLGDKPFCENCKHRMIVKLSVTGQAQHGNGHQIKVLGMVTQLVEQSYCKLVPTVPITTNPLVVDCTEFEVALTAPQLRKPLPAGMEA